MYNIHDEWKPPKQFIEVLDQIEFRRPVQMLLLKTTEYNDARQMVFRLYLFVVIHFLGFFFTSFSVLALWLSVGFI